MIDDHKITKFTVAVVKTVSGFEFEGEAETDQGWAHTRLDFIGQKAASPHDFAAYLRIWADYFDPPSKL